MLATADVIVLAFAALGVLGPTIALRKLGAALFAAAAAFVSAEQVPKVVNACWRAAAATRANPQKLLVDDLPNLTVKA